MLMDDAVCPADGSDIDSVQARHHVTSARRYNYKPRGTEPDRTCCLSGDHRRHYTVRTARNPPQPTLFLSDIR